VHRPTTAKKLPAMICGFLLPKTRVIRLSMPLSSLTFTNERQRVAVQIAFESKL
jgi:hypothetical protein